MSKKPLCTYKPKKIQATTLQKKLYEDFCRVVRSIESTVPSAIFLVNSTKHKNFRPMFLEDEDSVVLKAKYVFRNIHFPDPVSNTKILFDTDWDNPRDVDWKKECKDKWKDFYMISLNNNMFFIDRWLGDAYYTMKNIDSKYDFNISKNTMYDKVFDEMILD